MIISRKRFEEEINKAVTKREEELWQKRNQDDEMRDMWRTIHALEDRVYKLEPKENNPCENVAIVPVR